VSDFLPHPFWNFSLELYAGEGVAEACLDLQERRGCDVNILLFCCWLGASGRPTLTADRLRSILRASDAWQAEIPIKSLGPVTLTAALVDSQRQLAIDMLTARTNFYTRIVQNAPSQSRFSAGWANRVEAVAREAGL